MASDKYKCPICGSNEYAKLIPYKAKSDSPLFRDKNYAKCAVCQAVSMLPMPSDNALGEYYENYWESKGVAKLMTLFEAQAKARFAFVSKHIRPKNNTIKILDVGAGYGLVGRIFVEGFPDCNVVYDAVELEPSAVKFLKETMNARNVFKSLEDVREEYTLIVLAHIIEHFSEPLQYLEQLKERLEESGVILIEVPNQDFIYKAKNEPHLISYSPSTLKNLVERSGYMPVKLGVCGLKINHFIKKLNQEPKSKPVFKNQKKELKYRKKLKKRKAVEFNRQVKSSFRYGRNRQWIRLIANKNSTG